MAYRRNLISRTKLFGQQRSITPSISHFNHRNDEESNTHLPNEKKLCAFTGFRSYSNGLGFGGSGVGFRDTRWCRDVPMGTISGFLSARNMSSSIGDGVKEGVADKFEYIDELAEFLSDKATEVVTKTTEAAPAISEVAVAAADSWPPVAALQYAIDGIHTFTGLNWWASIVITTLIIRTLSIPILINQLKATTKLTILRPELEQIKQEMQDKGMSPSAVSEGQAKMKRVFSEHGVSTFTPLKGLLIQGPVFVSFFLAIRNMVDKVPSFQTGGVSWFTDLTTADPFYLLPCLTAFTFWITVECNMQEGLEGNPAAGTMKNVSRAFAALTVPLTATFPKALFCYWITSNLFSLVYGLVIKQESVKKFLNIPIIVPPLLAIGESRPPVSFWDSMKKYAAAKAMEQQKSGNSEPSLISRLFYPSRLRDGNTSSEEKPKNIISSAAVSHRIKNLEKQAKGRKKNKRRSV
uniref:mitochondrial inner membrane protein OXA1-like n=1 Tax=Erigeron canadensis TaxID=72917 RepID=UPI001CB9CF42|nr:mitochondrial inner membrane protein OXA1-like [Erigeron canadensis]